METKKRSWKRIIVVVAVVLLVASLSFANFGTITQNNDLTLQYNDLVNKFNSLVEQYNNLTEAYNKLVAGQASQGTLSQFNSTSELHCLIQQFRNGTLISWTYHAMSETNFGHNQTRDLLGGVNTNAMLYLANSNDTGAFDATWTALPAETVSDGLGRALGTYTLDPTGNGKWNITLTWTADHPISAQLYGVYSQSHAAGVNTLCYAEQQGSGNVKNLAAGDTLAMTIQGTS